MGRCLDSRYNIEPSKAADYIHYLVQYQDESALLHREFHGVLTRLIGTCDNYSARLQQQLQDDLRALHDVEDWHTALSRALTGQGDDIPLDDCPVDDYQDISTDCLEIEDISDVEMSEEKEVHANAPGAHPFRAPLPVARVVARRAVEQVDIVVNDPIYEALNAGNMRALEALLHQHSRSLGQIHHAVEGSVARHDHRPHSAGAQNAARGRFVEVDRDGERAAADELVERFLTMPDGEKLRRLISRLDTMNCFDLMLGACSRHQRYQLAIQNAWHPVVIHLPIHLLPPMIESFISRGLYVDHQVLMKLVDAFAIRLILQMRTLSYDDKQVIFSCQNTLIKRGLTHHRDAHHRRVVPRLEAMLRRVASRQVIFADDDADIVASPFPVESSPPQRPASVLAQVASRPHSIASTGRAAESRPSQARSAAIAPSSVASHSLFAQRARASASTSVNVAYCYEAEDIQAILGARMREQADVVISSVANMATEAEGHRVVNVLGAYLAENHWEGMLNKRLIIPINLNNRWVGITLTMDERKHLVVKYYDSYRDGSGFRDALILDIKTSLRKLYVLEQAFASVTLEICDRCLKQMDTTSCGVYLIENLYSGIRQMWWSGEINPSHWTKALRQKHLDLLREFNPIACDQYVARQTEGLEFERDDERQRRRY